MSLRVPILYFCQIHLQFLKFASNLQIFSEITRRGSAEPSPFAEYSAISSASPPGVLLKKDSSSGAYNSADYFLNAVDAFCGKRADEFFLRLGEAERFKSRLAPIASHQLMPRVVAQKFLNSAV